MPALSIESTVGRTLAHYYYENVPRPPTALQDGLLLRFKKARLPLADVSKINMHKFRRQLVGIKIVLKIIKESLQFTEDSNSNILKLRK